jgi:hypothetical protein
VANADGDYSVRISADTHKPKTSAAVTVRYVPKVPVFKDGVELEGDGTQTAGGGKMNIKGDELNALKDADPNSYIVIKANSVRTGAQWFGQINTYIQVGTEWEPFGLSSNGFDSDEWKFTLAKLLAGTPAPGGQGSFTWDAVGNLQIELESSLTIVSVFFYEVDYYEAAPVDAAEPEIVDFDKTAIEWDVAEDDELILSVEATVSDGGELSYEWFRNSSESTTGATSLGDGETDDTSGVNTLTLDKTDYPFNGDYYFYVVVTNTNEAETVTGETETSVTSDFVKVTVKNGTPRPASAETPSIATEPASDNWALDGPFTLTVVASVTDGGTLSYQWYQCAVDDTVNLDDDAKVGTNSATLTLSETDAAYENDGDYFFYVVVTNTNDNATTTKTATKTSAIAIVSVEQ